MRVEIIYYRETNVGGHHQPLIAGNVERRLQPMSLRKRLSSLYTIKNTQCGVHGARAKLNIDDYEAAYDFVNGNNYEWSEIPDRYKEKVRALNNKFNTYFSVESKISKGWE